ncbi:DNRLRE domain-containing protein [Flagellimonas iocasae]|uniref:DNRLRE domain-containing protein n=1 Tax=Flagellimonas iocasae TaxID=2055905 RepID=A0ABW4XYV7_9FLAO
MVSNTEIALKSKTDITSNFFRNVIKSLGCLSVFCLFISCSSYEQKVAVLKPNGKSSKDAIIARAYPSQNYSRLEHLHLISRIKNDSLIDDNRILIYFDLADLSLVSKVDSAHIYLYSNGRKDYGQVDFQVLRIVEPWSDERVTWSKQPKVDTVDVVTIKSDMSNHKDSIKIDVTSFTDGFFSRDYRNFGFLIRFLEEDQTGKRLNFYSSDTDKTSKRPELQIFYHSYF